MWDNTEPICEACKAPLVEAYDFVDRHGDIERLCGCCYIAALHPKPVQHARLMEWLCLVGLVGFAFWLVLQP